MIVLHYTFKKLLLFLALFTGFCSASLAATFTVENNTWTNTVGSLLWAINQANATAGPHIINFNPAGAPYVISPTSQIELQQEIIIDGATSGQLVELNGSLASNTHGFAVITSGANSEIRGFIISEFDANGIFLFNTNGVTVGGNKSLNYGNIISNNGGSGILIQNSFNNIVIGNYIGLDATGSQSANTDDGILIFGADATNNTIGGSGENFRNVISGNGRNGINIAIGTSTITGNYIGTDITGTNAIANTGDGVLIAELSTTSTIGGNTSDLRNVISGNTASGIHLRAGTHIIMGNYIGTNASGDADLGNLQDGIRSAATSDNNVIGGDNSNERNVISGNGFNGIRIEAGSHTISGNYIGLNAAGTDAIGNTENGIDLIAAGDNNIIGGILPDEGNVISGNLLVGLRSNAINTLKVFGNIIGLDAAGLVDLGNGIDGIYGRDAANDHQIGGPTEAHRNIISGNGRDGIFYEFDNTGLLIQGNYIGSDINGTGGSGDLGNGRNGVFVNNTTSGAIISDNTISGNGLLFKNGQDNGNGIMAFSSESLTISNNIVGLEANGLVALGNNENGISLIISGSSEITGNTISSNGSWQANANATSESPVAGQTPLGHGFVGNNSSNINFNGNKVGVDLNGEGLFGNLQSGVIFLFGDNYTIGTTNIADRNIIGNNLEFGIHLVLIGDNSTIKNNFIGISPTSSAIGNDAGGIYIDGINNTTIGGSLVNEPNTIANSTGILQRFATGCGICNRGNGSSEGIQNLFSNNSITCNFGLGIDLNNEGNMYDHWSSEFWGSPTAPITGTGNISKAVPTIDPLNSTSNTISGTGLAGDQIQLFDNTCDCEGETYLAATTVASDGTWSMTLPSTVTDSSHISAIAIDVNDNTSEFTACCRVQADSLNSSKDIACIGEQIDITLSSHVGLSFQLQSATNAAGPWSDVAATHVFEDSTWSVTPTSLTTMYYRVLANSTNWGASTTEEASCTDISEIIVLAVQGTNPTIVITDPEAVCSPNTVDLTALTITTGSTTGLAYTYWTDAEGTITYSTPSTATTGTYYIKGETSGCSNIEEVVVTVNTTPSISLTATDPTTCNNNDGSITINGLTADTKYAWSYTNPASTILSDSSTTNSVGDLLLSDLLVSGGYTGITVNVNECISNTLTTTLSDPANPTIEAGDNLQECNGTDITLTGIATTGAVITWNNGITDGVAFTPNTGATTYTATATLLGCTATDDVTITIDEVPNLIITDPTAICSPNTVDITDPAITTGSTGNGTTTYWTDASASISYTTPEAATAGTYYIKSENGDNSTCFDIEEVTVTVNTTPTFSTSEVDPTECTKNDGSITLNNLVSGTEYNWSYINASSQTISNTGTTDISGNLTISNALVAGGYTDITVSLNGCLSSPSSVVLSDPGAPTVEAGDNQSVCFGTSVTLTATASNNAVITWSDGVLNNTSFIPPVGVTSYTATANSAGCTSSDVVTVTVSEVPNLTITNLSAVCSPNTVNLSDAITSGATDGDLTYWTDASATISYPNHETATAGTYYIKSTNSNNANCSSIEEVVVSVTPLPNIEAGRDQNICLGDTVNLNATSSTTGVTIEWNLGIENGVDFIPSITSSYTATATTVSGCSSSDVVTVTVNEVPELTITTPPTVSLPNTIDLTDTNITFGSTGGENFTYWLDSNATMEYTTPDNATNGTYYIKSTNGSNSACFDIQPVVITIENNGTPPVAVDDVEMTNYQEPLEIDVINLLGDDDFDLDGDDDIVLSSVRIISNPSNGTVSVDPITSQVTYTPNNGFSGTDLFTYTIFDQAGLISNIGTVTIVVKDRPALEVVEHVSPNGDGINDGLHILNIEYYPNTNIEIFNRWGNLVWELPSSCNGYQNGDSECSFTGESSVGISSGGLVPDGSYFYVVDGSDDDTTPSQGFFTKVGQ